MSDFDFPKRKRQGSDNTVLAIFLLLPFLLVALFIQLRPAISTFTMSLSDFSPLRDAEFVGVENYSRLFSDPIFFASLRYTVALSVTRIVVFLIVPVVVGLLVGIQGKVGRILNRFVLGILAALISPIALIMLWRGYWGRMWGREPSPLYPLPETLMLSSPIGAVNNTLLLDTVITLAIAVVVGTILVIAILRGREVYRRHVAIVGFSVWVIGLLFAVGSALYTFMIPYLLTRGGPLNSTVSPMLYAFEQGFQFLRLGSAAAQAILMMIPIIIGVLIIWFLITTFRIRLIRTVNDNPSQSGLLSILSLPLIILLFAPVIGLFLWGRSIAVANGGYERLAELINWNGVISNLAMPILAIWLIQIPISYLAGMALGLFRPFNRTVMNVLFLVILVIAFLPAESLFFRWYVDAADAGMMDTKLVLAMPWLVSGVSLLIFKLYFDGIYDEVQTAHEQGQATDKIVQKAIVSSVPLVLLMGLVSSFMCIQSLLWPFIALRSSENFTPTVSLTMIAGQYTTQIGLLESAAVSFVGQFFLPFGLAFGLLCGFGLEQFALVGGGEANPIVSTEPDTRQTVEDQNSLANEVIEP